MSDCLYFVLWAALIIIAQTISLINSVILSQSLVKYFSKEKLALINGSVTLRFSSYKKGRDLTLSFYF